MTKKISFEDALILNAIRAGRFLVGVLPMSVSMAGARAFGRLVHATSKRRSVAHKNLRLAFAGEKTSREMRRIARASMENLAMSFVDLLGVPKMTRGHVDRHFRIEGVDRFTPYLAKGQGVIFLTGHFGSWELLNIAAGIKGYPMVALARVQKHPRSDAYLNELRASKGSQVIHKGMPVREILRALKRGQIVGILSDQDGGKTGTLVEFFGRLSSTPSGAATFSLRTGAPIFPAFIFREKDQHHRIEIEGPLELPHPSLPPEEAEKHLLQQFASMLEGKIRRSPEQWLWAHRRWKSSPDRRVVILSDGKAGHLNQSLALFEALKRERAAQGFPVDRFTQKTIEVRFKSAGTKRVWKALGLLFGGHPPFAEGLIQWALESASAREVIGAYADIVLSCGSSLTEINLWMKRENSAKSMVVMDPKPFAKQFDAVIVPRHDHVASARNVFETDGALPSWDREAIRAEAEKLASQLKLSGGKRLGLLVGGDTAGLKFDEPAFEAWVEEIRRAAVRAGVTVLATTSRRTPGWADAHMKRVFADRRQCPLLVIANEANRAGVVAGILGLSDVVAVTGESMSMISEAASSGKPVLVFNPWKKASLKKKYEDALGLLEKKGVAARTTPENFESSLKHQLGRSAEQAENAEGSVESVLSQAAKRVF